MVKFFKASIGTQIMLLNYFILKACKLLVHKKITFDDIFLIIDILVLIFSELGLMSHAPINTAYFTNFILVWLARI